MLSTIQRREAELQTGNSSLLCNKSPTAAIKKGGLQASKRKQSNRERFSVPLSVLHVIDSGISLPHFDEILIYGTRRPRQHFCYIGITHSRHSVIQRKIHVFRKVQRRYDRVHQRIVFFLRFFRHGFDFHFRFFKACIFLHIAVFPA